MTLFLSSWASLSHSFHYFITTATVNYQKNIISGTIGQFKLKFTSLTQDKIFIQYEDSSTEGSIFFTYNDNWNTWGPLSSTPYYTTNRIYSQLLRTTYQYVHICKGNYSLTVVGTTFVKSWNQVSNKRKHKTSKDPR